MKTMSQETQRSENGQKVGVARLAAAQAPDEIDEYDDGGGNQRHAQEGMSEAAVMVQAERGAAESAEDVDVGGFGGQS